MQSKNISATKNIDKGYDYFSWIVNSFTFEIKFGPLKNIFILSPAHQLCCIFRYDLLLCLVNKTLKLNIVGKKVISFIMLAVYIYSNLFCNNKITLLGSGDIKGYSYTVHVYLLIARPSYWICYLLFLIFCKLY